MAIYHLSAQILGRSAKTDKATGRVRPGSKAVAAAAYRSGERLTDDRHQTVHDYSNRQGVRQTEIMAPDHAPAWIHDRAALWNTVEAMESRVDAQLAREFNIALPHQLTHEQRVELVRTFVRSNFVERGMVADIAWHDPVPEKGDNPRNFHAHVMLALRRVTPQGLDPVKTREWNSREILLSWRASWTAHVNDALREAGRKERVDHRTLKAQREDAIKRGDRRAAARLDREPEIHVGVTARRVHAKARQQGKERVLASKVRESGPKRRQGAQKAPQRRRVDYPQIDTGSRVAQLRAILALNADHISRRAAKAEKQITRLQYKVDYWERQFLFHAEGHIKGGTFRFLRAQKAAEEKRQREEATRKRTRAEARAKYARDILHEVQLIFAAAKGGSEAVRKREREIAAWEKQRDLERSIARALGQGRERKR